MAKAVLISIRPEWVEKIVSGEKTVEIRKSRPNLKTPFKCYIYCTKPKYEHEDFIRTDYPKPQFYGGGKVIGEFTCDRIDGLAPANEPYGIYDIDDDYVTKTCLAYGAMWDYGKGKPLFGWNILGFQIHDKPSELGRFTGLRKTKFGMEPVTITRPPQSWCYVEELENE